MTRWICGVLALLLAEAAFATPPVAESSEPEARTQETSASQAPPATSTPSLAERNIELLKKHSEIWELMGLSATAREELNDTVLSINTGIYENRRPDAFEQARAKRRSDEPLSYQEFLDGHTRRFALLEISEPTQAELLAALTFTWKALHDPTIPAEQREVAEKIRELMKSMGGPPPCCDDSIFERAGMAVPEP